MRKVLVLCLLGLMILQPALAQIYSRTAYPPGSPPIPNYGTNGGSVDGNFNVVSILNAILTYYVQSTNYPDLDVNSSLTFNSISGSSARTNEYGPLQDGFYLNHLGFETELSKGVTVFGNVRNQDDFNRAANIDIQNGSLHYSLQYTKMINRVVTPAVYPNTMPGDETLEAGYPNNFAVPQAPQLVQTLFLSDLPGFNPNAPFVPKVVDFLNNSIHYTFNDGLGFLLSNQLTDYSGQDMFSAFSWPILVQGPLGIDNQLSQTTFGLDYTSAGNWQIYANTKDRTWINKLTPQSDITDAGSLDGNQTFGFQYPGAQPAFLPPVTMPDAFGNLPPGSVAMLTTTPLPTTGLNPPFSSRDEDTNWNDTKSGLQIPVSHNFSITASWENWYKSSAGTFNQLVNEQDANAEFYGEVSLLQQQVPFTDLQPTFDNNQYRAQFNYLVDPSSNLYADLSSFEESPNSSVLHETHRQDYMGELRYTKRFGDQSISIYGSWQQERLDRTVDYQEIRILDAFNPFANTQFPLGELGTATYNGEVTFVPSAGVSIPGFTTNIDFLAGPPSGRPGFGMNTFTYPVGGIITVPAFDPNFYCPGPANCLYPVVEPVGRLSFTYHQLNFKVNARGPLTSDLDYNVQLDRTSEDNALFRTDPMDYWKGMADLTWTPLSSLFVNASYNIDDNKSNSKFLYPWHEGEYTEDLEVSYDTSHAFSVHGSYFYYNQKVDFSSPVYNTATPNFIGLPGFLPASPSTGPYPITGATVSSSDDIGFFAPFAQSIDPNTLLNDSLRNQDQELTFGMSWHPDNNWSAGFDFTHSRPQTFQNLWQSGVVSSTTCFSGTAPSGVVPCGTPGSIADTFHPNAILGFQNALPLEDNMQSVDGRRNSFTLNISRALHNDAILGLTIEYTVFRNLAPQLASGSFECGPAGFITACPGVPALRNVFNFGPNSENGDLISTSLTYIRHF